MLALSKDTRVLCDTQLTDISVTGVEPYKPSCTGVPSEHSEFDERWWNISLLHLLISELPMAHVIDRDLFRSAGFFAAEVSDVKIGGTLFDCSCDREFSDFLRNDSNILSLSF